MKAEDVLRIYCRLEESEIQVWLDGGWGVDALLEEQTHHHKDLDVIVQEEHVNLMKEALGQDGFEFSKGTSSSFTLSDSAGLEIDVHVVKFDEQGNGIYRMQNDQNWVYPAEGFGATGKIKGVLVRCLSPSAQMLCHTGYEIKKKDIREMKLLNQRFGVDFPKKYAHLQSSQT